MKKSHFLLLVISILIFTSCKKASSNNGSSNIEGNYKGGTLYWNNTNGNSGSDPNFTFTITSLNSNSIKLNINTKAPISSKTFTLPLTDKTEYGGSGAYTFSTYESNASYSKTLTVIIAATPSWNNANIDYSKTSSTSQDEDFDGDGYLEK